jgi:hypothetical protein
LETKAKTIFRGILVFVKNMKTKTSALMLVGIFSTSDVPCNLSDLCVEKKPKREVTSLGHLLKEQTALASWT